jgi:hypothetical protein
MASKVRVLPSPPAALDQSAKRLFPFAFDFFFPISSRNCRNFTAASSVGEPGKALIEINRSGLSFPSAEQDVATASLLAATSLVRDTGRIVLSDRRTRRQPKRPSGPSGIAAA